MIYGNKNKNHEIWRVSEGQQRNDSLNLIIIKLFSFLYENTTRVVTIYRLCQ